MIIFFQGFLLEIQKHPKDASKISDAPTLLTISDKIHIVLVKNELSGDRSLLSSHHLDWRRILSLADGRSSFSLEMNGIGTENNVPVGVLDIKLALLPRTSKVLFTKNYTYYLVDLTHLFPLLHYFLK